jgi:hypothetical protein
VSHESQHTPAVFQVTALLQEPQGYLSVLGPGFGSGAYEFANNMAQRYNNTSKSGFNLFRSICIFLHCDLITFITAHISWSYEL